jgi:hypothetical protein
MKSLLPENSYTWYNANVQDTKSDIIFLVQIQIHKLEERPLLLDIYSHSAQSQAGYIIKPWDSDFSKFRPVDKASGAKAPTPDSVGSTALPGTIKYSRYKCKWVNCQRIGVPMTCIRIHSGDRKILPNSGRYPGCPGQKVPLHRVMEWGGCVSEEKPGEVVRTPFTWNAASSGVRPFSQRDT